MSFLCYSEIFQCLDLNFGHLAAGEGQGAPGTQGAIMQAQGPIKKPENSTLGSEGTLVYRAHASFASLSSLSSNHTQPLLYPRS